jgi:hypothetical protein
MKSRIGRYSSGSERSVLAKLDRTHLAAQVALTDGLDLHEVRQRRRLRRVRAGSIERRHDRSAPPERPANVA